MGSDHYIIEMILPTSQTPARGRGVRQHRVTDWPRFHTVMQDASVGDITSIEAWTESLKKAVEEATDTVETSEDTQQMDSRLAHMLEARRSLQNRWKSQRGNRTLRKRVAELGRAIERYSKELRAQQWHAVCNAADGQLHTGRTWKLLRHLLDSTSTRGFQQHRLSQVMATTVKSIGERETVRKINEKYLPRTATEKHADYCGTPNPGLDSCIEEWEVRAVLQELNCKSAAGPDLIPNKALRNLNDGAIADLTRYYNRCWLAGKLPQQWKTARTVLIPKPGKPPSIDNLRPISLTSCVGKILEHVLKNRWQRYLESEGLYPETMLGFRERLSTQDVMLMLRHKIIDRPVH